MQIIKCTAEDLDRVAAFYDKVTEHLVNNINYPKWVPGKYPGKKSVGLAIDRDDQYACIDNGEVVGAFILNDDPMGDYSVGEWKKELNDDECLVIHTLASDPEAYQKGVGRYMVEYCIDEAAKNGYKAVRLDVVPGNEPAIKLYRKLGFTFAGEKDLGRNLKKIPTFELYESLI